VRLSVRTQAFNTEFPEISFRYLVLLSQNRNFGPMTGADCELYAEQIQAEGIPVFGDDDQTAVDALPWDGQPVRKCVLLPNRTIAKCITGHGDDQELKDFIKQHHAENN